ncbi:MIR motif-containing protein [Glomus cerebriforme]|uniref:MIR motif-containing protein n=1 Tax=Glomus cerebriforme TaxID=658196 RepID=A0A397SX95_9GLOM|nr:MIR motif-containing protein [Glomus cerebriforme]
MLEHRSQIRYGSKIALKHIATGRFLSSKDIKYEAGSRQQMVFCSNWQPDKQHDCWIVIPPCEKHCKPGSPVPFNSVIGLKHQQTSQNLHSHDIESPKTKQQEVTCCGIDTNDDWLLQRHSITSSYDDSGYLMVGDIISLRHINTNKSLSSHDFMLNNGNQEVTCHSDGHEENHKVELFKSNHNNLTVINCFYS